MTLGSKLTHPIKACIFDLDGVIVDTAHNHYLAWRKLANSLGFDFTEEQNEQLKGISRVRSLEILLDIGGIIKSEDDKKELADLKNTWYLKDINLLSPNDILPGILEFLKEIKALNLKIALGSASKNALLILERLQIKDFFSVVVDGTMVTKAKPDPEVFLQAAQHLSTPPQECIVFEDAQAGIEAAKNGNMHCIAVGSPAHLSGYDGIVPGFNSINFEKIIHLISN